MQEIVAFMQHHWILSLSLIIVLVLLIIIELIKQKKGTRLSPQQVTLLINHENAVVVDVRSSDAFASGHIIGAISWPLANIENKSNKLDKYKSQPIVLVCAAGLESERAAASLTKKGFNVRTLAGGLRAWRDAEMPLTKDK